MQIFHVTIASKGRRPPFPKELQLRRVVHALARIAGSELILYYVLDDHLHLVFACDRTKAGRLAQRLGLALRPIASQSLESARIRPVENRTHLISLVAYVLRQAEHHNVPHHPALWTGSCFQDLVGARHIEGLHIKATIIRELPRFRLRTVFRKVGLPDRDIKPLPYGDVFELGIRRLVDAGTAASAVDPGLKGRSGPVVQAKAAIVTVGLTAGFSANDLARVLERTAHSVRNLARRDISEPLVRSIRVRLSLEQAIASIGTSQLNDKVGTRP